MYRWFLKIVASISQKHGYFNEWSQKIIMWFSINLIGSFLNCFNKVCAVITNFLNDKINLVTWIGFMSDKKIKVTRLITFVNNKNRWSCNLVGFCEYLQHTYTDKKIFKSDLILRLEYFCEQLQMINRALESRALEYIFWIIMRQSSLT